MLSVLGVAEETGLVHITTRHVLSQNKKNDCLTEGSITVPFCTGWSLGCAKVADVFTFDRFG